MMPEFRALCAICINSIVSIVASSAIWIFFSNFARAMPIAISEPVRSGPETGPLDQAPHPGGNEITGTGHVDRGVVIQHVEPDAMCLRKLFGTETGSLHLFEKAGHRAVAVDRDGTGGNCEKLPGLNFLLSYHIL